MDAYELLGLSRDASAEEVRRAFRRMALDHHPDQRPADQQAAAELRMQQINEARRRAMRDLEQRRRAPSRPSAPKAPSKAVSPVIPLQRDSADRVRSRAVREAYRTADELVPVPVVAPESTSASGFALVLAVALAVSAAIALAAGAAPGLVLALLGAIVIVSVVSLW